MTTPPLDLPALRAKLRITKVTDNAEVLALLDRLEAAEAESKALRSAVETSNDAWAALTTRAEAAEKAVAAVREVHVLEPGDEVEGYCDACDNEIYPCPTITALDAHTPETETP